MADDRDDGMNDDLLGYNEMVERAMRSVVRQALDRATRGGLPGNHHFYITFRTDHPETLIPNRLKEQYPEEMTIVLQHQFWGLHPDDEGFDVELSFNRKHEHLRIPYDALITFADPSVNFGLQFHVEVEDDESDILAPTAASDEKGPLLNNSEDEPGAELDGDQPEPTDNVVTLDAFRKK